MIPDFGYPAPAWLAVCVLAAGLGFSDVARAQSSCSSDGQSRPVVLLERFINADCADCWADPATPRAKRGQLALDWIVPGARGDEAPLSAAATHDATARLSALRQALPPRAGTYSHKLPPGASGLLRVAHGLPVSGYVGASIGLKAVPGDARALPWTAWLALVESVPAGTEGTPVARNLIRNVLQVSWAVPKQLSKRERISFSESRSMDIAPGSDTRRLRVVGWVEDAQGRVIAAAQSRCAKP